MTQKILVMALLALTAAVGCSDKHDHLKPVAKAQEQAKRVSEIKAEVAADAPVAEILTVFRYRTDEGHFFATSDKVKSKAASLEGEAFKIFGKPGDSRMELFMCDQNGHQFLSVDAKCDGQKDPVLMGYIGTQAGAGLIPLLRMQNAAGDYLQATDAKEGIAAKYTVAKPSLLGYVPEN